MTNIRMAIYAVDQRWWKWIWRFDLEFGKWFFLFLVPVKPPTGKPLTEGDGVMIALEPGEYYTAVWIGEDPK